jgi:hypothetical protein
VLGVGGFELIYNIFPRCVPTQDTPLEAQEDVGGGCCYELVSL